MKRPAENRPYLKVIDVGEELLRRAHETARAIQERVWKAMDAEDLSGLQGVARQGHDPTATGPEGET
jgi:hypothetical protein